MKTPLLVGGLAGLLCSPVCVADAAESESLESESLGPIIITATRTPQSTADTLVAVTVITRQDIERQQASSVYDLLRGIPGLTITQNGGLGKINSVFLRGTESDHVLVLVDGIKVGSATAGTTAFEQIPVEHIERIEIVRGPRASLYGSEAIGGVIQIFTRKGQPGLTPGFSLGAGRYNTYQGSASLAGSEGNAWFNLGVSRLTSAGFNSCNGDPQTFAGCAALEPDADGYQQNAGQVHLGYRFNEQHQLELHWLRTTADNEFDGTLFGGNVADTLTQVVGLHWSSQWSATSRIKLSAGQSEDESHNYFNAAKVDSFATQRQTVSLQNDWALGDPHQISVGLDYGADQIHSTQAYSVTERDHYGVFTQYLGHWDAHDLQLSVRQDDHEPFGQQTTGGAAWGYSWNPQWQFSLSYSTAFKAPSLNELYFPGFGNPELEPETASSIEVGINGRFATGHWALNLYQTRLEELIGFDPVNFTAVNIDSARIRGLEWVVAATVQAWQINANLTWLDPVNQSADYEGNILPRRAQESLRLDVDRPWGRYALGATVLAVGSRYDDLANRRKLAHYVTLDLRAEYPLAKHWRLQAKLDNATDTTYETADFYNQAERSVSLLLRYQP